jgi:hypothetical protein
MEGSRNRSKLTRGRGTGHVSFGSESEEQQAAKMAEEIEAQTARALMTPQERFESIERALRAVASDPKTQPHVARTIQEELG